jgi:hypothetical protein
MALTPDRDPLTRAVEAARRTEPEWVEVSTSILDKVRAAMGPSEPLIVFSPDGEPLHDEAGSHTYLSSRVLRHELRRLLQSQPTHAPERIELDVEDRRLATIAVRLVAAYGVALPALGDRVREDLVSLLRDLLGPDPSFSPADVVIEFTDVVDGDPNRV